MLAVLAGLLVWVPSLLGWGSLAAPALLGGRLGEEDEAGLAFRGFAGLGLLGTFGAALNVFTGLGPGLSLAALIIGLGLFVRDARSSPGRLARWDVAMLAGLGLLVALFASGPIRLYDTGLYHFQAVAWSIDGPLPAGLANLHRRFGLTSLWTPASALLELPLFSGRSAWLVSSLAVFFFGSAVLRGAKSAVAGTAEAAKVFLALGAVPMAFIALGKGLPSLSTDLPVTLLTILSAQFLLRPSPNRVERRAAVSLAALAGMLKLSAAVWFAAVLLVARAFPFVLMIPAAVWVMRGVTLSGYLVYPASWTRLPFLLWAVSPLTAREEIRWARSWGRLPDRRPEEVLSGWDWLGPWVRANVPRLSVLYLLALFVAGLVALAIVGRRRGRRPTGTAVYAVAAAALASSVYWFLSAPDIRFGYGALFVLSAIPLTLALQRGVAVTWPLRARVVCVTSAGAALLAASVLLVIREREWRPALMAPPAVPHATVKPERTRDGETVFVPVADDRCWDAPRPCTPYFDARLVIERDGSGRPRVFWLPPVPPLRSAR